MKAPLTGNSITDRVMYTGLFVPEQTADRDHHDHDAESTQAGAVAASKDAAPVASLAASEG